MVTISRQEFLYETSNSVRFLAVSELTQVLCLAKGVNGVYHHVLEMRPVQERINPCNHFLGTQIPDQTQVTNGENTFQNPLVGAFML